MKEAKEFLTVMEFADKLRIHPNTVRKGITAGRIQAFRTSSGSRSGLRIPSTEVNRICEMDMMKLIEKIVDDKIEARNA
jgi:excisionase family DNA binding protein